MIGRTKLDDIEMADDVKPSNSHVALNTIVDPDGEERQIVRDNMPFGTVGAGEFGTYFIGYAAHPDVTEQMLTQHVHRRSARQLRPDPRLLHRRHRRPVLRSDRGLPRRSATVRGGRDRSAAGRQSQTAVDHSLGIGSLKGSCRLMNNLHRELAPISDAAWADIEAEARRTFTRHVAGAARRRRDRPGGEAWPPSAPATCRSSNRRLPGYARARRDRSRWWSSGFRSSSTARPSTTSSAARRTRTGSRSRTPRSRSRSPRTGRSSTASPRPASPASGRLVEPAACHAAGGRAGATRPSVAQALTSLRLARGGRAVQPAAVRGAYTAVAETTDHGYPILTHMSRVVGSDGEIIWAPAIDGAFLLSDPRRRLRAVPRPGSVDRLPVARRRHVAALFPGIADLHRADDRSGRCHLARSLASIELVNQLDSLAIGRNPRTNEGFRGTATRRASARVDLVGGHARHLRHRGGLAVRLRAAPQPPHPRGGPGGCRSVADSRERP